MIVVGDHINAGRNDIGDAISKKDTAAIQKMAKDQEASGANYIGVNAEEFIEDEPRHLKWLVNIVQEVASVPCCIDSCAPKAIESALAIHKGMAPPMVNAISLEKNRYEELLPLLRGTNLKVVALCKSDEGLPETTRERLDIADKLINGLVAADIPLENIFVDPLVQPISVHGEFGIEFLHAVETITTQFRGVHTICGLSNISSGLPCRKYLNRIFAVMAVAKGLDGLITDPMDKEMMADIAAAERLAGRLPCAGTHRISPLKQHAL
ncbi:MAG: dihydropteroate synthase [Desulfobacterales bacterium]|nr:dihydropteroate synthase [Desulfobacterales bacterium]